MALPASENGEAIVPENGELAVPENGKSAGLENGESAASSKRKQTALIAGGVAFVLVVLIALVLASVVMLRDPARTETIRDIVIIFLAAESVVFGLVLVILIVQVARLTALIENELRPILESTNETLGTLRGTTQFLSRNMVSPVIRVNSSVAALKRALGAFRVRRTR